MEDREKLAIEEKIKTERRKEEIIEEERIELLKNIEYNLLNSHKKEQQDAFFQLTKLAKTDAHAMWLLGLAYYSALGINKNYKLACQWYKQSADAGHKEAKEFYDKTTKCN